VTKKLGTPSVLADGEGEGEIALLERAGSGSSATVFRGETSDGQVVAVKRVDHEAAWHEAELLARLDLAWGPSVVASGVVAAGSPFGDPGAKWVALSWAEGRALSEVLSEAVEDRVTLAARIAHGVGRALEELHALGACHGDVKPANIVVAPHGSARDTPRERGVSLVDYGFATRTAGVARGATPRYAAPELVRAFAGEGADEARAARAFPAADLYALGRVLHDVLAGAAGAAGPAGTAPPAGAAARDRSRAAVLAWAAALTSPVAAARPEAAWVADRAAAWLGLPRDAGAEAELRVRAVYRAAVAVAPERARALGRGMAVAAGVEEPTATYLREAGARLARLGVAARGGAARELSALEKKRWLVGLVGPRAASFAADESEARLAARLARFAREHGDLRAVTARDLGSGGAEVARPAGAVGAHDEASLARALASPRPESLHRAACAAVEARLVAGADELPASLVVAYTSALLRRGEVGPAYAALEHPPLAERVQAACESAAAPDATTAEACVLAAEIARRRGQADVAARAARAACAGPVPEVAERARAVLGRLAWERGELAAAEAALGAARPFEPYAAEVRGLVAYTRLCCGELAAEALAGVREELAGALAECGDGPLAARLEAVVGMLAHAAGEAGASLAAFTRALAHAGREGAIAEEASYATGAAAAATDAGDVPAALEEGTRAALLWERLGQRGRAARAWLSRAAAYALVGQELAAAEAANEARELAEEVGDHVAAAYALWAFAESTRDAASAASAVLRADACLAAGRTVPPSPERPVSELAKNEEISPWAPAAPDEGFVRSTARLLVYAGGTPAPARIELADGHAAAVSLSARWEYWGARAHARGPLVGVTRGPRDVLAELGALLADPGREGAQVAARGPSLASAAALARELGEGDAARRFETATYELGRRVRAACARRPELVAGLPEAHWLSARARRDPSPEGGELLPAQIAQLEGIVRSLSSRERLRPLLDQVLDALVLWTGVSRGLLLLRAPNGELVPRAGRNLARRDLEGEQLRLSTTLARRAFESGEAIVALDAFSSHGDTYASVHALRLRSVLAVPLLARGEVLGVVYLDDRVKRGAFGERELAWVRLLATQAAMAISDARDKVLLRRALRKEARASAQLRESLGRAEAELTVARATIATEEASVAGIVGRSGALTSALRVAMKVAASDVPVLVLGESGTGKELVARAIHERGARKSALFVAENCGSVPEALLESTLFGHVKGAFTGASATRTGLFELAHKGTLFLDEIGEMPPKMQVKLLRVLADGEVRPVGGDRSRKVDVRIVAATHRDLSAMVKAGTFREDLYYRLAVVTLTVPPLRERPSDIPLLLEHFLRKYEEGRKVSVTRAAMAKLVAFGWPGNVRQLENEVRRALVLAEDRIDTTELSPEVAGGRAPEGEPATLREKLDALETELVRAALEAAGGNQTRAAKDLGVSRFGLQKMVKRLGVR